ncbi:hypothetical protein THAOC_00650, partial [Thalassiosira oceanica]
MDVQEGPVGRTGMLKEPMSSGMGVSAWGTLGRNARRGSQPREAKLVQPPPSDPVALEESWSSRHSRQPRGLVDCRIVSRPKSQDASFGESRQKICPVARLETPPRPKRISSAPRAGERPSSSSRSALAPPAPTPPTRPRPSPKKRCGVVPVAPGFSTRPVGLPHQSRAGESGRGLTSPLPAAPPVLPRLLQLDQPPLVVATERQHGAVRASLAQAHPVQPPDRPPGQRQDVQLVVADEAVPAPAEAQDEPLVEARDDVQTFKLVRSSRRCAQRWQGGAEAQEGSRLAPSDVAIVSLTSLSVDTRMSCKVVVIKSTKSSTSVKPPTGQQKNINLGIFSPLSAGHSLSSDRNRPSSRAPSCSTRPPLQHGPLDFCRPTALS